MGVFSCLSKSSHCGFIITEAVPKGVFKVLEHPDKPQMAEKFKLPEGKLTSCVALSPRKIVVVIECVIYLCTKESCVAIHNGGTISPLIGTCGKTLYAALQGRRELHKFNRKTMEFSPIGSKFDIDSERLFGIATSNSDKHNILVVIYLPDEANSRVLEIDRRTGERRDLNCPSDVMSLTRVDDRLFATGSVSSRNTKQFFQYSFLEDKWTPLMSRAFGVSNQSTDKVFFVHGYFVSFAENNTAAGNDMVEVYDIEKASWTSKESDFTKVRAVANC